MNKDDLEPIQLISLLVKSSNLGGAMDIKSVSCKWTEKYLLVSLLVIKVWLYSSLCRGSESN